MFRIRVGVTGHRTFPDPAAVEDALRGTLKTIAGWFPATDATEVEFALVSALAEGADRLAATAARDGLPGKDTQLEAVLPFERDEYEQDFQTERSTTEFRALLASASSEVRVPPVDNRDIAYERAGQFVVDRSDIMIAVWDGHPARGRGGTAETIAYAERQGVLVLRIDAADPRSPAAAERPPELEGLRQAWARIDEYNRLNLGSPQLQRALESEHAAFTAVSEGPIHWKCAAVAEWAVPHLVRSDFLAVRYQLRYVRLGDALFSIAALATTAAASQVVFLPRDPRWALVEVAMMLILLVGVALGRRARVHEQWIAYRSLAEAFRAAPFIALTGLGDRPADDEGASTEGSDQWYQRAFSEAWRARPGEDLVTVPDDEAPELGRIVSEGWIQAQIGYHQRTISRFKRLQRVMTLGVIGLFGITLIVGLLHAFAPVGHDSPVAEGFSFIAIALPGFGAALSGIRDQRQYRLHADRSERTADRLERIRRALATETSLGSIQKLALDAQRLMAEETLDWSSVLEFQDLEIVV